MTPFERACRKKAIGMVLTAGELAAMEAERLKTSRFAATLYYADHKEQILEGQRRRARRASPDMKAAKKAQQQNWRNINRDRINTSRRLAYAMDPVPHRARARTARLADPAAHAEACRKWRRENIDRCRAFDKAYADSHRSQIAEKCKRRWAKADRDAVNAARRARAATSRDEINRKQREAYARRKVSGKMNRDEINRKQREAYARRKAAGEFQD